jgi:hypothetical protein
MVSFNNTVNTLQTHGQTETTPNRNAKDKNIDSRDKVI